MASRILMLGRTGQLAQAVLARARTAGRAGISALGRDRIDVTDRGALVAAIDAARADLVVNATAWTDVDGAEADEPAAFAVNAEAPRVMAEACAARGLPFVHVSTDYVFPGTGDRPWREDDATGPLNAYGRGKRAGEIAVLAAHDRALVIRTSWVFSPFGRNFVKTMLDLRDRPRLRIVDDQEGRPTDADELARFILFALPVLAKAGAGERFGLLHVAGGGTPTTWDRFAEAIFAAAGGAMPQIEGIGTRDYAAPAPRPGNGVLDLTRLRAVWGFEPRDWREGLIRVVGALSA